MPQQQKNVGGFALLNGFINAYAQEAERLGEDPFEVLWVYQQMLGATALEQPADERQRHNFQLAQDIAISLLEELVTDPRKLLEGWQDFGRPKNPAQTMAHLFVAATSVFQRALNR